MRLLSLVFAFLLFQIGIAHAMAAGPKDEAGKAVVAQAKKDLAKRLSMPEDGITLVKFRKVTWPDSSLGCPKPGESYMQAIQEGALVRLKAEGKIHNYHSGSNGVPTFCENAKGKEPPSSSTPDTR